MGYTVPHHIGGQLVNETSTKTSPIFNPAHGEIIGQVHFASQSICDKAVATAKEAGIAWAETANPRH